MKKLIRHKWTKQDGFRIHTCAHCGLIRYWDNEFRKLMYKTKWKIFYYGVPECKRVMHSDVVYQ
jgi:hypothetical protein